MLEISSEVLENCTNATKEVGCDTLVTIKARLLGIWLGQTKKIKAFKAFIFSC